MSNSGAISFYVDALIVETVLGNGQFQKTADSSMVSSLLSGVGTHVKSLLADNAGDTVESILNILGPGLVAFLAGGWFGMLAGLALKMFDINIGSILRSFWQSIRGEFGSSNKVTTQQIDAHMQQAVQSNTPAAEADTPTIAALMYDAKLLRLAVEDYDRQTFRLFKEGAPTSMIRSLRGLGAVRTISILSRILGAIVKVALYSAGLTIGAHYLKKYMGMEDSSKDSSTESTTAPNPSAPVATQTKFHLKGDAPLPASVAITNTPDSIENQIIQWAKETYDGLDGQEENMKRTPAFQTVKEDIVWHNSRSPGNQVVFLPTNFTSKKKLVDFFIDDVAKNVK
jgi:hypothetical protein